MRLECVAEYTGRPLLPLTGGDIGSTASEVENNLRSFLRRGQDWNAVVLLDEADVYLSARDRNNIERNSVVSVFLREIEYYRGILFLTTNQIGQFDEAITSRKIWENNIERLRKERKDIKIDYNVPKYIKKDLLHLSWNGREIRNAFQTAVSLALFAARDGQASDVELTTKHIEQVVEMSNNFKTYIDSTLDADAAARAKFNKIRNDEFTAEQEQL
ncbi:MAG: hypothetical protein M1820_008934 [Bogoriella megaspora]|nr:MAG: hypothetical protein M1820_008934 [Bogoriella megaspora]